MSFLVPLTLFGWIPVTVLIFAALPPRRAVTFAFLFAWLFLPCAGYILDGLPDYTKSSATSLAALLGTALFNSRLLLALRPRWFDLPMITWTLCPIASSLSNGLGFYDGIATSFDYIVIWGLPYLIGRVYFTRLEHLRELAIGIVIGGLVYVPLCLWELRMSPQLQRTLYGVALGWGEMAYGGYRPVVFMSCALDLGLWMTAAATTGVWLWASGALKTLRGAAFGWLLLLLFVTAVMCKVAGSWFALTLGVSLWYLSKWSRSRLPALVLILLPTLYILTRASGLWTGETAVSAVETVLNERRAGSLAFRMKNEDILTAKALKQPIFGWGGWSRARVYDAEGHDISITDGFWVIALGNNGLVGVISFYSALLLPMVLLVKRFPADVWQMQTMAPACVLATLANLYAIDCLANGMVNLIYLLVLGGVTGVLGTLDRGRIPRHTIAKFTRIGNETMRDRHTMAEHTIRCVPASAAGTDPRAEAAIQLGSLGRSLMERGMTLEAEEAWLSASDHWAALATDYPDEPEYRKRWLNGLNDAAWSLLSLPRPEADTISRARQLAQQTVRLEPGTGTYWNTLGIAYFRGGDYEAAIHALERSMQLDGGGTSFDYFFLAMAYWEQGDRQQARHWYSRANAWMEENTPVHEDLLRFRAEAEARLNIDQIYVL
jgi:tetratricopeptide (TPR) repeat protein